MEVLRRYSNISRTGFVLSEQVVLLRKLAQMGVGASRPPSPRPVRQSQRRLSPEELRQLLEGYHAGVPVTELVTRYRINRTTLFDHARKAGGSRRYPKLSAEDVAHAARMYTEGKSLLVIGDHFGVANTTVRRALAEAGVAIRPRH